MNNHIDLERAKRITNGEHRHFSGLNFPPPGDKGGFWKKNIEKKLKILHVGVILEGKK